MKTKLFEIRDKATFIPAIGVLLEDLGNPREHYLLRRAGYGIDRPLVLLARLEGGDCHYDPFSWENRTMSVAHQHIQTHWDSLETGALIDVQFLLEETERPKITEAETEPA